jgi:hypothetical protein
MIIASIILVGILSYLLDLKYNKNFKTIECKKSISFHLILLAHHLLAVYIIFGIFSNNKTFLKIYACVLGIIIISWILFNDYCLITYHTNKICEIPVDTPFSSIFGKIFNFFNGKSDENKKDILEYVLIPSLIFISFFRISKLSKK